MKRSHLIVLSRELWRGGVGGGGSLLNGLWWVNVPISVSGVTAVGHEPWCTPLCVSFRLPVPSLCSGLSCYTHGNGPVV